MTSPGADPVASVNKSRLMSHVREFSKWTKHAGSAGELRSLEYVKRELGSYGYEVELVLHDAYVSLPVSAVVRHSDESYEAITHSFSRSSGPDGVVAELVSVGSGTKVDFDAVDVRSKAVLVDGIANSRVTVEACRRGAVAQIHVSPDGLLHDMCISPVWGSPSDLDMDRLPTTAVVSVGKDVGARLRSLAAAHEAVRVFASVDTKWIKTPVLAASLETLEANADEPFVLFTGHHDTWYYGVMDNGGANATMLEVARVCAEQRRGWNRGLRIVFLSGHSQGRYSSSAWYADHHWEELETRAVVHVNIDSTGGIGNTVVSNATACVELSAVADSALRSQAEQAYAGRRMQRAGDQAFWGIGVPALFANMGEQASNKPERVGPGTGWWWHTPDDTIDKIDPQLLERDTRIYAHAVWNLLSASVLPLDYLAATAAILRTLEDLQRIAADRFDLSVPISRAMELHRLLSEHPGKLFSANNTPKAAARANETLRRLSRLIVPIEYTLGRRFEHDPALPSGSVPALGDLKLLASLDPADAQFHFLRTRLIRSCNWISISLRNAVSLVNDGIVSDSTVVN